VLTAVLADDYGYLDLSSVRFLLLAFFLIVYWVGNLAASKDRKTEVANIILPLWARRVLFLWHPNPFRLRTVIGKIILIVIFLVMFTLTLTIPDNRVTYITVLINLLIQFAYIVFFGHYVMKKN